MFLDLNDSMMQFPLCRFREKVAAVADGLEEQVQEVRCVVDAIPEDADFDALLDVANNILRIVDGGHEKLHLYHNLFGTLHDLFQSQQAIGVMREQAEARAAQLAVPPATHWEYLERIVEAREYVPCRIRQGSRWHTGSLAGMRVRDSSRAAKSQYVSIFEHNFDTLQVKVGSRYVPFAEAYPLEGWTAPEVPPS